MKSNLINKNVMKKNSVPVDEFIDRYLYHPNKGYYMKKIPFGSNGDFITSPTISNLFSEIIAIWIISSCQKLGNPNIINLVELGPGDGSLSKVVLDIFEKFPKINNTINYFLYDKSKYLKKIQKKKLSKYKVNWINNFNGIKNGPVIFFGNEFFDAVPIKQFKFEKNIYYEKYYGIDKKFGIIETYKKAKVEDIKIIKLFDTYKKKKFIELPKQGFKELDKIVEKISSLSGGILLIDYGYLKINNRDTIQAVKDNKRIDIRSLHTRFGDADISYLVNFGLLKEYFLKKNLKTKKIVNQKFFLERMGIHERVKILNNTMNDKQKEYMNVTLNRLLHKDIMGELFKVIFAFNCKDNNFLGFE